MDVTINETREHKFSAALMTLCHAAAVNFWIGSDATIFRVDRNGWPRLLGPPCKPAVNDDDIRASTIRPCAR